MATTDAFLDRLRLTGQQLRRAQTDEGGRCWGGCSSMTLRDAVFSQRRDPRKVEAALRELLEDLGFEMSLEVEEGDDD